LPDEIFAGEERAVRSFGGMQRGERCEEEDKKEPAKGGAAEK
jgi:hypothetical protein